MDDYAIISKSKTELENKFMTWQNTLVKYEMKTYLKKIVLTIILKQEEINYIKISKDT